MQAARCTGFPNVQHSLIDSLPLATQNQVEPNAPNFCTPTTFMLLAFEYSMLFDNLISGFRP
jgi:hypothetical protein